MLIALRMRTTVELVFMCKGGDLEKMEIPIKLLDDDGFFEHPSCIVKNGRVFVFEGMLDGRFMFMEVNTIRLEIATATVM